MAVRTMGPASRRAWALLAAGSALVVVGCSRGYERENVEALAPLNSLPGVIELGAATSSTGCTTDTCWFGDDITLTTVNVTFEVDVDEAVPAIASALGADRYSEQDCTGPYADCLGGDRLIDFEFDGAPIHSMQLVVFGDREGALTVDTRSAERY